MLNRKKMKRSEIILFIGGGIILIARVADLTFLTLAGIVVAVTGLLAFQLSCRCPWCGKPIRHLTSGQRDPGYCKYCGYKLEFDE